MSNDNVTEVVPHDEVVLIAVLARSLDDVTTLQLVDDVETAAYQRIGVPILLDLTRLKFAPSVALGQLVQLSKSFKMENRPVGLFGVDRRVMSAIRVTQLDKILDIHPNLERALASISRD